MNKNLLFALAGALLLSGCTTDHDETRNAAQALGLRDVVAGDLDPLKCGQDDKIGRSFTATNVNGDRVHGVVCCGIAKGCTVRF